MGEEIVSIPGGVGPGGAGSNGADGTAPTRSHHAGGLAGATKGWDANCRWLLSACELGRTPRRLADGYGRLPTLGFAGANRAGGRLGWPAWLAPTSLTAPQPRYHRAESGSERSTEPNRTPTAPAPTQPLPARRAAELAPGEDGPSSRPALPRCAHY